MPPAGILVYGLVQGSLAGLNSLGLVLLWRSTRLVNLAQPALGLVGGVLVGLLVSYADWSFWFAAPLGIGLGAFLGYISERLVLRRLQESPRAVLLVATVGLAAVYGAIQTALPFAFEGPLPAYTIDLGFTLDIFPVRLLGPHILTLAIFPVALAATAWFMHRTRFGLAATALGQDAERARALGVPSAVVRSVVWVVAGMLATVSGILAIPVLGFSLGGGLGPVVLLLALAPAVFARLRSLAGAAVAALALGVAYEVALWYTSSGGTADLVLAGGVLAAVAVQRGRLARAESAARASSWEAAATPRPLAWPLAALKRVRMTAALASAIAVAAAALTPLFIEKPAEVWYTVTGAFALASLAVAVAWMFAGELALGHWGFAGLGAAVAALAPGPWPIRCLLAALAVGAGNAVLGLVARRQASLAYPVIGLAAAAAAPVALLAVGKDTIPSDPGPVAAVAGALAIAAAVGVARLRASRFGLRMVAARDDPARGPWLGADPIRTRVVGLALSGVLAGFAGGLYLAVTRAGVAPGGFDATRSLDLLAMAVVGGLGSPFGALVGAMAWRSADAWLPGPWALLATGVGVLIVVIFKPAGLGRVTERLRDAAVALLTRPPRDERRKNRVAKTPTTPPAPTAPAAPTASAGAQAVTS